jgi:hypothetical protein
LCTCSCELGSAGFVERGRDVRERNPSDIAALDLQLVVRHHELAYNWRQLGQNNSNDH